MKGDKILYNILSGGTEYYIIFCPGGQNIIKYFVRGDKISRDQILCDTGRPFSMNCTDVQKKRNKCKMRFIHITLKRKFSLIIS